ncbi:MAG: DEAD/DEAH box helicase family protein [Bacteroidales bacterium]|nr:DEAD/DEAH box helicase family protein [Bacteroidales bacterium]
MIFDELIETERVVMAQLKDFQRATVERVDYLFRHQQNRVLVADEVGLGKTLIAKGVIAKTAKLRYEEHDDLCKVVYVCSNQSIARQNLTELNIFNNGIDSYSGYRLSMQFYAIEKRDKEMKNSGQYVQLLTLTPETSFNQRGGMGTIHERMLLTAVLDQIFDNATDDIEQRRLCKRRLHKIMNGRGRDTWDRDFNYWCYEVQNVFPWKSKIHRQLLKDRDFMSRFYDYLLNYNGFKSERGFIGFVRRKFAEISVEQLNPDLVIMDEFQRFKFLIEPDEDSETSLLARKFLTSADKSSANLIRVLLLSATPYKLFSTLDELGDDNDDEHFNEFKSVVNFLYSDDAKFNDFQDVWNNYSTSLKELKNDQLAILNLRNNVRLAEEKLYGCMCRTERISVMESNDYIDDSSKDNKLEINENDINSYREIINVINNTQVKAKFTVDFVKSSPYILSFMQNYDLKQKLIKYFKANPDRLSDAQGKLLWVNKKLINDYEKLPTVNSRLTRLLDEVFKSQSYAVNNPALFLWVPPSMPYYEFGGVYRGSEGFSKVLIFSAWEMVPRMIASLVSYEEERLSIGRLDKKSAYFASNRTPENRIGFNENYISCLTYPCRTFADMFKPQNGVVQRLESLQNSLKKKIAEELDLLCSKFQIEKTDKGNQDQRWYWFVPQLLDYVHYNIDPQNFSPNNIILGRQPDDLIDVLCNMVLGSPAVCLYRARKDADREQEVADWAHNVAREFVKYFNTQAKTAIVELANNTKKFDDNNHWQNVLMYCTNGNFQAMIDEYIHLLKPINKNWEDIKKSFAEALGLYTTTLAVDSYDEFCDAMRGEGKSAKGMRSHYAVAFINAKSDEKTVNRKDSIRKTFNSPFWPFVLASTSIGQEGLDFHLYCRKIMHWNLPTNPIDLEQREGRINRFKCLAIRQNLARKYADQVDFTKSADPWQQMFDAAYADKPQGVSDLIPFWCFGNNQEIKIERLLACYPFSRDESSYERLVKILSLYRLTLGQPRQEELLEYVFREFGDVEELKDLFINLSPIAK